MEIQYKKTPVELFFARLLETLPEADRAKILQLFKEAKDYEVSQICEAFAAGSKSRYAESRTKYYEMTYGFNTNLQLKKDPVCETCHNPLLTY
jgi:hypothetical protein